MKRSELLAKVPGLHVPARTSSFYFKGKSEDIPTIARRLMVAHVLEGSVRKSGDHVRITVQLVRADNGYHVWSQTYDRTLDDIFKVQDEIAGEVVKVLQVSLSANELPRVAAQDSQLHGLVLQARFFMNRSGPGDQARAAGYYQQAVQLAPDSAPAWAGLSKSLTFGRQGGGWQTARLMQEAREPALQAKRRRRRRKREGHGGAGPFGSTLIGIGQRSKRNVKRPAHSILLARMFFWKVT